MPPATVVTEIGVAVARDDTQLARATIWRVSVRLLPLLFVLYICNFVDRTNVAIAALHMNADLHLSGRAYSLGVGIFFIGYVLFEVPSNVILARVGAGTASVLLGIARCCCCSPTAWRTHAGSRMSSAPG